MFYDVLGELLTRAAEVLSTEVRPHLTDDGARTQLDAVTALCADIGTMWPSLFAALAQENRILEQTVGTHSGVVDELTRYRLVLARLNDSFDTAHARPDSDAVQRLENLRASLSAAAAVQDALVATAALSSATAVKRV
jgi:hypothetical protein